MGRFDDLFAENTQPKAAPVLGGLQPKTTPVNRFAGLFPGPERIQAPETEPAESTSLGRRLGDVAVTGLKSAIGVPEAAIGLLDIPTSGYAGKIAENAGFRPKEAKQILETYYSPEQQAKNKAVHETEGFLPTLGAYAENPSVLAHDIGEQVFPMLGGGVLSRGVLKAAPKIAPYIAGAIGESALTAGQNVEQVRQETPGGLLDPLKQTLPVAASGALTGAIAAGSGKLAQKLGLTDIQNLLAGGETVPQLGAKGIARNLAGTAITEGALQELPQSFQEQVAQNYALDKPLLENTGQAAAQGLVLGTAMGGAGAVIDPATYKSAPAGPLSRAAAKIQTPQTEALNVTPTTPGQQDQANAPAAATIGPQQASGQSATATDQTQTTDEAINGRPSALDTTGTGRVGSSAERSDTQLAGASEVPGGFIRPAVENNTVAGLQGQAVSGGEQPGVNKVARMGTTPIAQEDINAQQQAIEARKTLTESRTSAEDYGGLPVETPQQRIIEQPTPPTTKPEIANVQESTDEKQNANARQKTQTLLADDFDHLSAEGLPLKQIEGNLFVDHLGDEVEDDYATPAKPKEIQESIDALQGPNQVQTGQQSAQTGIEPENAPRAAEEDITGSRIQPNEPVAELPKEAVQAQTELINQNEPTPATATANQPQPELPEQANIPAPGTTTIGIPEKAPVVEKAPEQEITKELELWHRSNGSLATNAYSENKETQFAFADFAEKNTGRPVAEIKKKLIESGLSTNLATNELTQISESISEAGHLVSDQMRINANHGEKSKPSDEQIRQIHIKLTQAHISRLEKDLSNVKTERRFNNGTSLPIPKAEIQANRDRIQSKLDTERKRLLELEGLNAPTQTPTEPKAPPAELENEPVPVSANRDQAIAQTGMAANALPAQESKAVPVANAKGETRFSESAARSILTSAKYPDVTSRTHKVVQDGDKWQVIPKAGVISEQAGQAAPEAQKEETGATAAGNIKPDYEKIFNKSAFDERGVPFESKTAANNYRIENGLDKTHTVAPITATRKDRNGNDKYYSGYVVRSREKQVIAPEIAAPVQEAAGAQAATTQPGTFNTQAEAFKALSSKTEYPHLIPSVFTVKGTSIVPKEGVKIPDITGINSDNLISSVKQVPGTKFKTTSKLYDRTTNKEIFPGAEFKSPTEAGNFFKATQDYQKLQQPLATEAITQSTPIKPETVKSESELNKTPETDEDRYSLENTKKALADAEQEYTNQGMVKNAHTRDLIDSLKKRIATIEHPEIASIIPHNPDMVNRVALTVALKAQDEWKGDPRKERMLKQDVYKSLLEGGWTEEYAEPAAGKIVDALSMAKKQVQPNKAPEIIAKKNQVFSDLNGDNAWWIENDITTETSPIRVKINLNMGSERWLHVTADQLKQRIIDHNKFEAEFKAVREQAEARDKDKTPKEEAPIKETTESRTPRYQLAQTLADKFKADGEITSKTLTAEADKAFGGTQAQGTYSNKDAYDAMETAVNLHLRNTEKADWHEQNAAWAGNKAKELTNIIKALPTQTRRDAEMDEYQQFSTPPALSFVANWVANVKPTDTMLEPSAGTGDLAIWPHIAGAKVVLNELSKRRSELLREAFPDAKVFSENAEQLNNILPKDVTPSVIVMNPPFSATAGRVQGQRDTMNGAKHIEQALLRLQEGGRLVAIVGNGMADDKPAFRKWWNGIKQKYNVRANIGISGKEYAKYGTTFDNQILVIDKNGATKQPLITGTVQAVAELPKLLEGIKNDRQFKGIESVAGKPEGGKNIAPQQSAIQQDNGTGGANGDTGGAGQGVTGHGAITGTGTVTGKPGEKPAADNEPVNENGLRGDNGQLLGSAAAQSGTVGGQSVAGTAKQPTGDDTDLLKLETGPQVKSKFSDSIFSNYQPQRLSIPGAKQHPGKLVQSSAMAAVEPPLPTYRPSLPQNIIKDGLLSNAQLEAVVYAGQAHSQLMPDGTRKGLLIGDGTGVGKGREIAGIIMDNMRQGRKKAIWVSFNEGLINDAKRDWKGVGGDPAQFFFQGKTKPANAIAHKTGIMFTTYSTMANGEKKQATDLGQKEGQSRLQQIIDWVGEDFDGVIAFDEAHSMGNSIAIKGKRGVKKPSKQALKGIDLQLRLPKARIVYVSATGATEISNLGYATRLGLWGEGTAFPNATAFINGVSQGGVAAMELVSRDMKALGMYMSRSLSYDGVTYERMVHELSPLQRDIYDELAGAWQIVLQNVNEALAITNAGSNGNAKSAAMSAFWGSHQRFFNQIITSMQTPSVIEDIHKQIDKGNVAVIQIVNTNEAAQERNIAEAVANNQELEELDFTPRQMLTDYVRNGFPVAAFEESSDENGNVIFVPVRDKDGNPVFDQEAIALRDKLLKNLEQIRVPENPLDSIISAFGTDMVAEVTGRGRRFVQTRDANGNLKVVEEKRNKQSAHNDADAFQNDKKKILVFSGAGGTGYSFHADKTAANQRKRIHYILQPGWRADSAVQGFGRTHRTNQATEPHYVLPTTDLKAQKRFVSSIARRLDQLGALTKGERKATSQGMFTASDNLESEYAREGLYNFFVDLNNGKTPLNFDEVTGQMGLNLRDENGAFVYDKIPAIPQFLNRLLSLKYDMQNKVFDEFEKRLIEAVDYAKQNGTYDVGLQTLSAKRIEKTRDDVAYEDKKTGAQTRYIELAVTNDVAYNSWGDINKYAKNLKDKGDFYVWEYGKHKGEVFLMETLGIRTAINGDQVNRSKVIGIKSGSAAYRDDTLAIQLGFDYKTIDNRYQKVTITRKLEAEEAKTLWQQQIKEAPKVKTKTVHMLTGIILPIWDRVKGSSKIYRLQTDKGEQLLGNLMDANDAKATLKNLGLESAIGKMPKEKQLESIKQGARAVLANGWSIENTTVNNEKRLEIKPGRYLSQADSDLLVKQGAFMERIAWENRYFIPTGENGLDIFKRITESKPVVDLFDKAGDTVLFSKADKTQGLRRAESSGLTVAEATALLPKRIQKMAEAGKLQVLENIEQLPEGVLERGEMLVDGQWRTAEQGDDAEALYDPNNDQMYLFAANLTKDTLPIVLTHETEHRAENIDPKIKAAMNRFEGDLQNRFNLNARGIGTKEEIEAYKRVIGANTPLEDQQREYRAYLGQQFAQNPDSFTGKLKKIFQEFIAAIRVALIRNGLDFGLVSKLTSADLWAMSRYGQTVPAEAKTKTADYRDRIEAMQKGTLTSAKAQGYKGTDTSEAFEWLRAKAKGLDMSQQARMNRAKDMEFTVKAYHATKSGNLLELSEDASKITGKRSDYGIHVALIPETANGAIIKPWYEELRRKDANNIDFPESIRKEALSDIESWYKESSIYPLLINPGKSLELPDLGRWDSAQNYLREFDNIDRFGLANKTTNKLEKAANNSGYDRDKWITDFSKILKEDGYASVMYKNNTEGKGEYSLMLLDSNQARSIHAAFDPDFKDSGNLLASTKAEGTPLFSIRSDYTPEAQAVNERALSVIDGVKKFINEAGPLGALPLKRDYLKARYLTQGRIADIDAASRNMYETFKLAGNEKGKVLHYLITKDASAEGIANPELRASAIDTKNMFIDIGQELVDRGLLSEDTYKENKGGYLPQLYLRFMLKDKDIAALGTGKRPSTLVYLKNRAYQWQVDSLGDVHLHDKETGALLPDDKALALGPINDPGYLAAKGYATQMRDIAILDWLSDISKNEQWILPKSLVDWKGKKVTPYWLKSEAQQIRKQAIYYTPDNKQKALTLANDMDEAADKALEGYENVPDGWKRVPDIRRYGAMRGLLVKAEIYNDIIGVTQINAGDISNAEKLLGSGGLITRGTQWWKWAKVAANPPSQIRNFISNGVLLHLSGVPFHKVPSRVMEAIADIRADGAYWKIAKKYGVTESTFAAKELPRIDRDLLDLEARLHGNYTWSHFKNIAGKLADITGDAYQMSEAIFKTAKIIDEMKKGANEGDAVLSAQEALFDYSLVQPSVRYLRNAPVGSPFLTFAVKALPQLLKVAATHPLRFAPYIAIPYILTALIANSADVDDDDVDKLKKALPEWLQKQGHAYVLPFKDENGKWQAMDFGYFFPWTQWTELGKQLATGEIGEAFKGSGLLGGPFPDLITAAKTGIDPFTQKEIMDKRDPPEKQIAALMGYLYRMAMPTWLTDIGAAGKMYDALTGYVDKRTGEPKTTVSQAALRFAGINLYSINPMETRAANLRRMKFEIQDIKSRRTSLLKDKNLTQDERRKLFSEYKELIKKRTGEMRDYAKESLVHPNLRTR